MFRKFYPFMGKGRGQQQQPGSGRTKAYRFNARPLAEVLEGRQLLAVTISRGPNYVITGDFNSNYIALFDFSSLPAPFAGKEMLVTSDGTAFIDKASIASLSISGLGGDDIVDLSLSNLTVPTTVD